MKAFALCLIPVFFLFQAGCGTLMDRQAVLPAGDPSKPNQPCVKALAFSPDGKYLASGHKFSESPSSESYYRELRDPQGVKLWLWEVENGSCRDRAMFRLEDGLIGGAIEGANNDSLRFSPDDKTLCVLSVNGLLYCDLERQSLRSGASTETNVMSNDAKMVAKPVKRDGSSLSEKPFGADSVMVLDGATGKTLYLLSPNCEGITPERFLPDGERLLISGSEYSHERRILEIWNLRSAQRECRLETDNTHWSPMGFSPDGKTLAMAKISPDSEVGLWDASTGKKKAMFVKNLDYFMSLAFSPDGRWLAIGSGRNYDPNSLKTNGELQLWDLQQAKQTASFTDKSIWGVTALAFSPDGKTLAVGDSDGHIRLLDFAELSAMQKR